MALQKKIKIAIPIAVLGIISLILIYVYVNGVALSSIVNLLNRNVTTSGQILGRAFVRSAGILNYNDSNNYVEYAVISYASSNIISGNLSLQTYSSNPLSRIYLIQANYSCFRCINEDQLYNSLKHWLGVYGLILNSSSFSYVGLGGISGLPSNSVLIIPSGLMPSALMPFSGSFANQAQSSPDILSLLAKGDTIIYAGADLTKYLDNGITYVSSNQTLAALSAAGLNTELLPIQYANHQASKGFSFNSPSYFFANGSEYGPLFYVHSENGTFITFSNYPNAGWQNANLMAHDFALAVYSRFWLNLIAQSPVVNLITYAGVLPLFTTAPSIPVSNSTGALINNSYSVANLWLSNSSSFAVKELPFRVRVRQNGTLSIPSSIGEGYGIPATIHIRNRVRFNNVTVSNISTSSLFFHLELYNSTFSLISLVGLGYFNTSHTIFKVTPPIYLKPGYYIASLRDTYNRTYDNALFYVPYLYVTPSVIDFTNGTFIFSVLNNGLVPPALGYEARLNNGYEETGTMQNGLINYTLPKGSVVPYGMQHLVISILGTNYTLSEDYTKSANSGIPPLYIEFGIAAIAILILNLVAKPLNRDEYFIEVPAFPPTEKIETKASSSSVLELFDTVNDHFGWRHMPLTAEEIRMGISSNIRYNNIPIMITTENATEILYKLVSEGKAETIKQYFMPKSWSEEVHHDIEYLVIFRRLRDFAVKNAILFTDLDTGGTADMVMANKGVQIRAYIHSGAPTIRPLRLGEDSKAFLVFLDRESKAQFMDSLYSAYGEEAEKLRIALADSVITAIDTESLEPLLY